MDSPLSFYSHEHTLFHHFVENGSTEEQCDVCQNEIYGMVYGCEVCKFTRHGSCARKKVPSEITHPSHSMHVLQLRDQSFDFLCERCSYNSRGPSYHCNYCEIDVDLACVSSTIDQPTQGDQGLIPASGMRKRTRHFSHGEPLALFKYRKTPKQFELDCGWCDKPLSGMSYGCFDYGCKFFLHESCISMIPRRLIHPFHPLHYLYVQYDHQFSALHCHACKRSITYHVTKLSTFYACHECSFYLHISCAGLQPTLKHKSHEHPLTYFLRNKGDQGSFYCCGRGYHYNAKKNKKGVIYRCVQCDFNIDSKCLPAPTIAKHRYHLHFLILHHGIIEDDSEEYYCDICEEERHPKHHIYYCKRCKFIAHVECVLKKVSDSKVKKIMHLVKRVQQINGEFQKLKETGDNNQLSKMQEIQFLLKDLEQEKKEMKMEKQKYSGEHISTSSDDTSSDYDDVDEGDKVDEEKEGESNDEGEQENESENEEREEKNEANQGEASTSINGTKELIRHPLEPSENPALEIHHFSHEHRLKIFHLTKRYKGGNCNACGEELSGTVYICKYCVRVRRILYALHKACTELPYELQHPLHSQHFLTVFAQIPYMVNGWFLCDDCGDFSNGFVYLCLDCQFKLDVKCAVLAAQKTGRRHPKHKVQESKLLHFSHEHMLVLTNVFRKLVLCIGCGLPILGPAYSCQECFYNFHESCLKILPQEIQHPFHPLHPLVALPFDYERACHACKMAFQSDTWVGSITSAYRSIKYLRYGCLRCELDLHVVCANSLRRVLKSNSHKHNLYYFGPDSKLFLKQCFAWRSWSDYFDFTCSTCGETCRGPFYRCIDCDINFHLKCVPVPQKIKSKHHIHHLTLRDSFIEDDIGKYYCDVCEEERHPKDHIYYCAECRGFFVTHIECVLSMDIEQVEYFNEDEKTDDNDHEEGNEVEELLTLLELEFERPQSTLRDLFTRVKNRANGIKSLFRAR